MHFKVGDLCKHFKGTNLIEKNIYEIVAVDVLYTGDNALDFSNIIIYRSIFQNNKFFAREEKDLIEELTEEQKQKYNQIHRVDLLTEEEIKLIKDKDFKKEKEAYIASKY